jgi:hypothetical protein
MPAGSCTAWNMAFSLMVCCPQIRQPEEGVTTASVRSFLRLELANMFLGRLYMLMFF